MSQFIHADSQHFPDYLASAWNAFDRINRARFVGPWNDPDTDHRMQTTLCLRALRHHGLTLDQAIEAAVFFPEGFGHLLNHAKLITGLWQEMDAELAQRAKEKAEARAFAARLFDPWANPAPPPWPGAVLPPWLEDAIEAMHHRDGVDFGAQAMACIAAASGAAPKDSTFAPYGVHWIVRAIIWVMIVADSGQKKTATIGNATRRLKQLHDDLWTAYSHNLKHYKSLPKDKREGQDEPTQPHSYVINDATPEALQAGLTDGRGSMILKDELASLFDFGRYSAGSGAMERTLYLNSYEGGPRTVLRRKDTFHVDNLALSVLGGVQPERLAEFKNLSADGLLARFCVIQPGATSVSAPASFSYNDRFGEAIEALARMNGGQHYRAEQSGSDLIRDTERAAAPFAELTDYGQGFCSFASKLHGTHARLAMILHMLEAPKEALVSTDVIERAGRLAWKYLLPHARNFYATVPGSNLLLLRQVASHILTSTDNRILASDITSGVKACRGMQLKQLTELLDPLVTGGWLDPEEPYPSNRAWIVVDNLRQAFAERRSAEAERKAATRELFRRLDA